MFKAPLNLLFLIGSVQALKIAPMNMEQDVSDNKLGLCSDPEYDPMVAPVLQELTKFFDEKGMTIYPTALSAVGALRYGGNTALVNGARHRIDHDFDLLVGGTPEMGFSDPYFNNQKYLKDSNSTLFELLHELQNRINGTIGTVQTGNLADFGLGVASMLRYLSKGFKDNEGNSYYVFSLYVKRPQNDFQKAWEDSIGQMAKEMLVETFSLMEIESNTEVAKGESDSWIKFDFYFKSGSQAELQPHPTKKMLYHGIPMRYPADPQKIYNNFLQMAFWHKKSDQGIIAAKEGMCGFAVPEGHVQTDMPVSAENTQVAKTCTAALQANGYESFNSLCQH